jgi:hypothetical protein
MITCLVGVLIFGSDKPPSTDIGVPKLLPFIDRSARPLREEPLGTVLSDSQQSTKFDTLPEDERSAIRPASHLTVLPSVVAPTMLGTNGPRIIEIRDGDLLWTVPSTDPIRLRQRTITVRVAAESGVGLTIETPPSTPFTKQGDIFESTLTLPDTSREYELQLKQGATRAGSPARLRLPDSTLPEPQPSGASNNAFKPVNGLAAVRVYGRYLRVSGTFTDGFTPDRRDLEFVLFETGSPLVVETRQPEMIDLSVDQQGIWTATLRLPQLSRHFNGTILVRATRGQDHRYHGQVITFNVERDALTAEAPRITKIEWAGSNGLDFNQRDAWRVPTKNFRVKGTTTLPAGNLRTDSHIVLYISRREVRTRVADTAVNSADGSWEVEVEEVGDGGYQLEAEIVQGDMATPPSPQVPVEVRTTGPREVGIEPANRLFGPGRIVLTILFSRDNPLDRDGAESKENYQLTGPGGIDLPPERATFNSGENSVTLTFRDFAADGEFTVLIKKAKDGDTLPFRDIFGHPIETDSDLGHAFTIIKSTLATAPTVAPGITQAGRAPYVPYQEFTAPRQVPDGFNPHDKVETRVARLYYYRDAHRVAQIINRKVQSYNRQRVDVQHQLADKARQDADQTMVARQRAEREAIMKAEEARQVERELESVQQQINRAVQELTNARRQPEPDPQVVDALDGVIRSLTSRANHLGMQAQNVRGEAARANQAAQEAEAQEKLAREAQFRREVAAAREDPDTFAPGAPKSYDPVEQVSVSVIGEGLIHLRGPLKGINTIRTMIDQIDQPAGQVRVAVHTVQINGEKQDRMEDVANIIQMYLDHSRFLTMQSSEMLRKAVVQVASRKAEEAMALYPGESQLDRDRRYLDAFFGREFIDELEAMDSEFLRTGNKILSLHSMDTTSLSSALNLLALAKNSTRLEILSEFEQMTRGELPMAEAAYMEAAITACQKKWASRCPKFYPMAHRAAFQSLKGFFDAQIAHDDTLTPLQREFIRLAQIFKSRLITELEYKQRVMERAVIEERGSGDYVEQLKEVRRKEDEAKQEVERTLKERLAKQQIVVQELTQLSARVCASAEEATQSVARLSNLYDRFELGGVLAAIRGQRLEGSVVLRDANGHEYCIRFKYDSQKNRIQAKGGLDPARSVQISDDKAREIWENEFAEAVSTIRRTFEDHLRLYRYSDERYFRYKRLQQLIAENRDMFKRIEVTEVAQRGYAFDSARLKDALEALQLTVILTPEISKNAGDMKSQIDTLLLELLDAHVRIGDVYKRWVVLREFIRGKVWNPEAEELKQGLELINRTNQAFTELLASDGMLSLKGIEAELARRPLDHKKFLDMLIDDLEEKYIELLDGTRAHTANVDNYLKRLTTAFDDDFNTQFYFPAFRYIRETSTHWDVQFGQVETTSILANNRAFAKVDPSASMDFDLPARSIAVAEALNGAKAVLDDVGALANDPTFLALASSRVNSASGTAAGSTGGFGVVRDVLPGLDSTTAEQIMAHNAGARPQFGSNLENLIPDPAIYKFETGTGYEIRPVIQPDGQAVVFDFNYMYTTQIREPVRADEKHLGRVKRHFINTDVQLSNFELREVSRYTVALKASRTSRGVPMLENIPIAGVLFRPLPSAESSLQQNLIYSQATIFPTLFDLMGLRWAPAVADLDALRVTNREFVVRGRQRSLENRVYDFASEQVDEFLRIPQGNRRADLYRSQETIPYQHPNGYQGPGLDLRDSQLQEGYRPEQSYPQDRFIPSQSPDGAITPSGRSSTANPSSRRPELEVVPSGTPNPRPALEPPAVRWNVQG